MEVTLSPKQLLLAASTSINALPLIPVPNDDKYGFGSVYKINYTTLNFASGDNVLFNRTKSVLITEGDRSYFITEEENIFLRETYTPLP